MRVAERMDFDHGGHDVARNERVAHASVRLRHAIANVAHSEDTGFAAGFEHTVADFFDQRAEVKRARMTLPIRAVDQHLGFAEVFLGPVHAQAQGIALEVHLAETLAAELTWIARHQANRCRSASRCMYSSSRQLTSAAACMPAQSASRWASQRTCCAWTVGGCELMDSRRRRMA